MKRFIRFLQQETAITILFALLISPYAAAADLSSGVYSSGGGNISVLQTDTGRSSDGVLFADDSRSYGDIASPKAAFLKAVQGRMLQRTETFTVRYDGPLDEVYTNFSDLLDEIYAYNEKGNASAGDYLNYNCTELGLDISYTQTECDFTFHVTYRTTAAQENFVDQRVTAVLNTMNVSAKDDYTKIKTVYDYVRTHFSYDQTGTKLTAYDGLSAGKMAGQGYALLMYKLLTRLDIPVRIIPGSVGGKTHAWNIVCLGGAWYNLDAALDSANSNSDSSCRYFLKNQNDFSDHIRESVFASVSFLNTFPMASQSFLQSDSLLAAGCLSISGADTLLKGGSTALSAVIYPLTAGKTALVWKSSDLKIAKVDQNGGVTAVGEGTAIISAATEDGSVTAWHSVTVADFSKASAWHREELKSLYDTGGIPAGLLGNYTSFMTRAEFAALLVRLCESEIGAQPILKTPFMDIGGHLYEREISASYQLGIVKGKSVVRFAPNDSITRQEAAKMLCSALAVLKNVDAVAQAKPAYANYGDAGEIGSWALPYVAYLTEYGILQGSGGKFMPKLCLTREQGMAVVKRMIDGFDLRAAS